MAWVRDIAEARWAAQDVTELPWWTQAKDCDEVANRDRHPAAQTFDGHKKRLDHLDAAISHQR